jgi:hypothetical protein
MDLITALPRTPRGNDSILVFVDRLTKMTHFAPCKHTITAQGCANLMLQHVHRLHGTPKTLITDRGTQFMSEFWTHFCMAHEISHTPSTAYHPQTDGQTERMNRLLEETLRHYVGSVPSSWEQLLPCAEFAINDSVNVSTGQTPFYLNYGRHPRHPTGAESVTRPAPLTVSFSQLIADAVRDARASLRAAQDRMKATADKRRREVTFSVGDKVLLSARNLNLRTAGSRKLRAKYPPLFTITALIGKAAVKLNIPETLPIHPVFHVSLVKPYHEGLHTVPLPDAWDGASPLLQAEAILSHRHVRVHPDVPEQLQFKVKWAGLPTKPTWTSAEDLNGCTDLIDTYWSQHSHTPGTIVPQPVPTLRRSARVAHRLAANQCACITLVTLPDSGQLQVRCSLACIEDDAFWGRGDC